MDAIIQFLQNSPHHATLPQPVIWLQIVVLGAVGGWSALLAHKAIANFHDGVRPIYPEFLNGRMSRRDLAANALKLSLPFVIGFGLPFSLASGLMMVSLLLLPADVIGIGSSRSWIAVGLGALWGGLMVVLLQTIFEVASIMPVNFVAPLEALQLPVTYALVAFPALAVALQYGPRLGSGALILTVIGHQGLFYTMGDTGAPEIGGMLIGIICLLYLGISRDMKRADASSVAAGMDFASQVARMRKHLPWLAVQGALLALASRLWILAGSEADFALLAGGRVGQAALADLVRAFAFTPLIAISALTTGVYQAVGLTLVYAVGFLSPHPLFALVAGAVVISVEVLLLERLNNLWFRFPSLRVSSEHLRGALAQVLEVALLVGSALAANQLIPDGLGVMIFVGLYVLNSVAGQVVYRMAAGPLIVLLIGLIANGLVIVGAI